MGNGKIIKVKSILSLFVRICNLHVGTWFEILESVAFDVLFGMCFIAQYICRIIPTKEISFPGVPGQLQILWRIQRLIPYTQMLTCYPTTRIHPMTKYARTNSCVELLVKLRYWQIRNRQYPSVVKALGSWQLRPTAISWNGDVSWLH